MESQELPLYTTNENESYSPPEPKKVTTSQQSIHPLNPQKHSILLYGVYSLKARKRILFPVRESYLDKQLRLFLMNRFNV